MTDKSSFSKPIVVLILCLVVVFTTAAFWLIYKTGVEPGVLIGCFFTFVTGELWALAFIRVKKEKKGEKDEEH